MLWRYIAADCRSLVDAEKYRMQILREVGKKVTEIQNGMVRDIFFIFNNNRNKLHLLIRDKIN